MTNETVPRGRARRIRDVRAREKRVRGSGAGA